MKRLPRTLSSGIQVTDFYMDDGGRDRRLGRTFPTHHPEYPLQAFWCNPQGDAYEYGDSHYVKTEDEAEIWLLTLLGQSLR